MTRSFTKLLIPLDGSRLAESVLPVAQPLAERLQATVSLLHVMERGTTGTIHGERHLANVDEAEAYLAKVQDECACFGASVERHVHPNQESDVVGSIVGHAKEFGADLIILATHGWGGMRDILVGSIAQQVLRRGSLPVLLVKPSPAGDRPPFEGRRLLVPMDGTESHDGAVLPVVSGLAEGLGASVQLLVVVPTLGTVSGDKAAVAMLTPTATAAALEMQKEDALEYLARVAQGIQSGGVPVSTMMRRGDPAGSLIDVAAKGDADLIVMSTHARAGLGAFWSASVGSKVLSRIRQPLLLVRAPESAEPH